MRILYLTDQIYLHGGVEKMLTQKINHWIVNYGYEVVLCTSEQRNQDFVYAIDIKLKHIDLGINYSRNQSYFHPANLIKSVRHFKALRKLIKKEQPDFIISVNYTPEQFFLPFIEKQIPKIKEFHSSGVIIIEPITIFDKLKHHLFLLLGKYEAQVVLNEDEKKYYPFQHLHVIPNFMEISGKRESLQREKTILTAGRMASVKQFDHLIKAWNIIALDFPDWQVKIFGDGDEILKAKLELLIQELMVPNIHLMGVTSHLDQEMQKASIYAMTSKTECFPMVLLEALAAGLPIISYDCPNGPRNIIKNNKDGILVENQNIELFAREMAFLIKDDAKRELFSQNAKINTSRFVPEQMMKLWNDLFINLIK